VNFQAALRTGNKKAFVDCFDASAQQEEVLGALMEFISAMRAFREAMEEEYGAGAFADSPAGMPMPGTDDEQWIEKAEIKVAGDTATVTAPGEKGALELVRKGGVWKLKTRNLGEDVAAMGEADAGRAVRVFNGMAKAVRETTKKVGKAGYSAEKINQELGVAMMAVMMQEAMKKPAE